MSMIIPNLTEPNLTKLVAEDHEYRRILKLVNLEKLTVSLRKLYSESG